MGFWLLKTEPDEWSWEEQVRCGNKGIEWNGVRNFQASKNLRNMKVGEKCFFYHTGDVKSIVGIAQVIKEAFLDKTDNTQKFVSIRIKALYPLKYVSNNKFWPTVRRVDEAFGDRNLVCSCPSTSEYQKTYKSIENEK